MGAGLLCRQVIHSPHTVWATWRAELPFRPRVESCPEGREHRGSNRCPVSPFPRRCSRSQQPQEKAPKPAVSQPQAAVGGEPRAAAGTGAESSVSAGWAGRGCPPRPPPGTAFFCHVGAQSLSNSQIPRPWDGSTGEKLRQKRKSKTKKPEQLTKCCRLVSGFVCRRLPNRLRSPPTRR